MALTYAQRLTLAVNPAFINRLQMAVESAAIQIAVDSPSTPLDVRRDRFARLILADPPLGARLFAAPVAVQFGAKAATDGSDITDAELDTQVAGVWNDLMGT